MRIQFDDAICLAMCQRGLRDRMLHHVWIAVLAVIIVGIRTIFASDSPGIRYWLMMVLILVGVWLIRVWFLRRKCLRLVKKLREIGTDHLDLQIGTAQSWGESVYLLDDYVFAPMYFLIVPYAEIEKLRVRTWSRMGFFTTDIQLTFYCGRRRYKTMLRNPQKFDYKRFENALQYKKLLSQNRSQS